MSPVLNKVDAESKDEVDEGFHSPSTNGCGEEEETRDGVAATGGHTTTSMNNNITRHNNKDSMDSTKRAENSDKATQEAKETSKKATDKDSEVEQKDIASKKARSLARYIVTSLTSAGGKGEGSKDVGATEVTLLRCVKTMMEKHEILFKGQMKRLGITRETGYISFVGVVNELFEIDGEGKVVVTWSRIVALYAFGAQIAIYCQEKGMGDFVSTIAEFLGEYAADKVTPFVVKSGGWTGLCEEFPADDDLENKAWKFLTWTAIGLGLAATASFFTSH